MTDKDSKKINQLLNVKHGDLGYILQKVNQLNEINRKIADHLDPNLKKHCQVANLNNGQLTIIAANSAVATQLHYMTPDLLRRFRTDPALQSIHTIQCKVRTKYDA